MFSKLLARHDRATLTLSIHRSLLSTNAKLLNKLGVKTNPVLRSAYEEALGRVSKRGENLLKTTKAVEAAEAMGGRRT